jgi:hypothetical protein
MRRALSISLIVLFWLPALVALAPGSNDARLPSCCRRHGAHHCAMDSAQSGVSGTAFKAPSHCPEFPSALPAPAARVYVAAAALSSWPVLKSSLFSRESRREAARAARLRTQVDRGPPASPLA